MRASGNCEQKPKTEPGLALVHNVYAIPISQGMECSCERLTYNSHSLTLRWSSLLQVHTSCRCKDRTGVFVSIFHSFQFHRGYHEKQK